MSKILRVCATPDAGFWTMDGRVQELYEKIEAHGNNYSLPCSRIGMLPEVAWSEEEESEFPITGFAAEMLLEIVANMGVEWDCQVSILPTYTATLYATTKQKVCDVGYVPYGVTAPRAYCAEQPPSTTSTPACPAYDPAVTWETATASDACCAAYNYNMMVTSVAGLVVRADNTQDASGGVDVLLVAESLNLLAWYLVVVVALANLVWLMEKTNPDTNVMRRDYINGSFDAIWEVSTGFFFVKTTCARMVALVYKYGSLVFFSLLTGTLSSMLTSARLQTEQYTWNYLQDISRQTVVCSPAPAYKDTFEILQLADTYSPDDNSLDTCIRDLEAGIADVVAYDEPTLHAILAANSTQFELFQVIPGTDELVLSSAFSGEVASDVKGTFEQAIIESQDQAAVLENLFFGSDGDEITSDSEDSSVIDEEAKDILLAFDWVGIGILSAYVLLMFVANMVDNHRKGLKCVCVRLAIVVRNQARQAVLHKRLSVTVTMGVDDLSGECREVFEIFDINGSGTIEEAHLDAVAPKIASRLADGTTSDRAAYEVKALLLEFFNTNVNGIISPGDFAAVFSKTIESDSARLLLRDVAAEIRRESGSSTLLSSDDSNSEPSKRSDIVPVAMRAAGRHRRTMLPPLEAEQSQMLSDMLHATKHDKRWTHSRIPESELVRIVELFGRRTQFSARGIDKIKAIIIATFQNCDSDEAAIAECTKVHHAILAAARRGSVGAPPLPRPKDETQTNNINASVGDNQNQRDSVASVNTDEATPAIMIAKIRELESMLRTMTSPSDPADTTSVRNRRVSVAL